VKKKFGKRRGGKTEKGMKRANLSRKKKVKVGGQELNMALKRPEKKKRHRRLRARGDPHNQSLPQRKKRINGSNVRIILN